MLINLSESGDWQMCWQFVFVFAVLGVRVASCCKLECWVCILHMISGCYLSVARRYQVSWVAFDILFTFGFGVPLWVLRFSIDVVLLVSWPWPILGWMMCCLVQIMHIYILFGSLVSVNAILVTFSYICFTLVLILLRLVSDQRRCTAGW